MTEQDVVDGLMAMQSQRPIRSGSEPFDDNVAQNVLRDVVRRLQVYGGLSHDQIAAALGLDADDGDDMDFEQEQMS